MFLIIRLITVTVLDTAFTLWSLSLSVSSLWLIEWINNEWEERSRIHSEATFKETVRDTEVTEKGNVRNSDDYSTLERDTVFSGRSMLNLIAICNIASGHIHTHHRENNFWGPWSCRVPLIHNTIFQARFTLLPWRWRKCVHPKHSNSRKQKSLQSLLLKRPISRIKLLLPWYSRLI